MTTTWKYLPVPEQDLLELAATVAERQWKRNEQAAPDTDDIDSKELASEAVRMAAFARQQPWSVDALAQLAADPCPILQRWAKVIDACVKQADLRGEPLFVLATDEVPAVTDLTVSQWQHAARQVSVELRKGFADTAPRWTDGRHKGEFILPLVLISGRNLKADKDQLYVGVTPEQARRWKEATGATT